MKFDWKLQSVFGHSVVVMIDYTWYSSLLSCHGEEFLRVVFLTLNYRNESY